METISVAGQKASCSQIWIYCQCFVHSLHNWNSVLYWKKENLEQNVAGHNYNPRQIFKNHIKEMNKNNLKKNSCYNIHSIKWEDLCPAKWGWYLPM